MNFLAHTFLSFSDQQIVGNLMGDFLKGFDRSTLPPEIEKGIVLHMKIDEFTDSHREISKAKDIFRPQVRLYSGVLVDIVMDFFLANDPKIKSHTEWLSFSLHVYTVLEENNRYLPEKLRSIVPRMKRENWLYDSRTLDGMKWSLNSIKRRANFIEGDPNIFETFVDNMGKLQSHYDKFFPELCAYITSEQKKLR